MSELEPMTAVFLGYAADPTVRYNASSGGVCKALCAWLVRSQRVNGAIITRLRADNPFEPETIVATEEDVFLDTATTAIYAPTNPLYCTRKALGGEGRFAFVGLPCHCAEVREWDRKDMGLRIRLAPRIGLFCNHTPSPPWTRQG